MPRPLKLLLVEDNPQDAELVLCSLRQAEFEPTWQRVDSEEGFLRGLDGELDLILSDFTLPNFSGLRALELLTRRGLDVPFIIVSGTIGEEAAVQAIKLGAADYLLKDRLARLGRSVGQALAQAGQRRERQRAETEANLYHTLFDHSNDAIEVIDPESARFLHMNAAGLADLGYSRTELRTLRVFDIDPASNPDSWQIFLGALRASGPQRGEAEHRRKDGTVFPIEFNSKLVRLDREYLVTSIRDITERKRAETALRESEARFRLLAQNINELFWMTDPATKAMLYVSPAYETIFGRTCESLYARPLDWIEAIHEEDRARMLDAGARVLETGHYEDTCRILRPDGVVRWMRYRAFPVRNTQGEVYRIVGTAEDITEQKLMEVKFLRTQRMEAIGTLASGIAHDLNNILAPVLMVTGLLKGKLGDAEDRDLLRMVERSAQRGAGIIGQLLTFSRGIEGARVSLQLRYLLKEMVNFMRETFPRELCITPELPDDLWPVVADATQIHQVLLNLCVNARDAMPAGGSLKLSARNVQWDGTQSHLLLPSKPGRYVMLAVADTGMGIPKENILRIFDPFFTTKEPGKGTGLGLSTVIGIVKSHAGFVDVESEKAQGTVFRIYLPAATAEAVTGEPAPCETPTSFARGELILVVDDEAAIRNAASAILEQHHYRVLTAENGEAAIERFLQHPDAVRLVLTDMMMPEMGGLALIRALRSLKPGVRVLASSGLDLPAKRSELEFLGVTDFLAKPFTSAALLTAVEQSLARQSLAPSPK